MLLYVHPALMFLTLLLMLYVLGLGYTRFAAKHMGAKTTFAWSRHALLGQIALLLTLAGMIGGLLVTWSFSGGVLHGPHGEVAVYALAPLVVVNYIIGLILHKKKKQRTGLPLLHAFLGVAIVCLFIFQAVSGAKMLMH